MGSKKPTRTEVSEKTERLDVCDWCGCDERAIDGRWKNVAVTNSKTHKPVFARIKLEHPKRMEEMTIAETTDSNGVELDPRQWTDYVKEGARFRLRVLSPCDADERLLCPHCFESIFGAGDGDEGAQ